MRLRSIDNSELEKFISQPTIPPNIDDVRSFLQMQYETGESKPEWSFVLEDDNKFLARIPFYTFPGGHPEYGILLYSSSPDIEEEEKISFICSAAEAMNAVNGARIFTLEVRNPSEKYGPLTSIFQSSGFSFSSSRTRYHLDLALHPPEIHPTGLIERSGEEMGEEEFIRALAIITSDSLDTEDQLRIKTAGLEQAARNFFTMERSRDTSMERWKLFYTPVGEFAGLVIPQFFHEKIKGTIGHIGVAPAMRGKGYGKFILSRGHEILASEGVSFMVDDCDDANFPSKKIMEKAGYEKQFTKEYYKKELATGRIFA